MEKLTRYGDRYLIDKVLDHRKKGLNLANRLPSKGVALSEVHEYQSWIFYRVKGDELYYCLIDPRFDPQSFDTIEAVRQAIDENL